MHELYSCTLAQPSVRQLQPVSFLGPSNGVKTKLSGHSVAKRQTLVVSLVTTKHFPPTILKLMWKDEEEVAFLASEQAFANVHLRSQVSFYGGELVSEQSPDETFQRLYLSGWLSCAFPVVFPRGHLVCVLLTS